MVYFLFFIMVCHLYRGTLIGRCGIYMYAKAYPSVITVSCSSESVSLHIATHAHSQAHIHTDAQVHLST